MEICSLTQLKERGGESIVLEVTATPVEVDGEVFIALFLRDTTDDNKGIAMAEMFLHDLNNLLTGIQGSAELLAIDKESASGYISDITLLANRMKGEIEAQRALLQGDSTKYRANLEMTDLLAFIKEVVAGFRTTIELNLKGLESNIEISCDRLLTSRVITNMVKNAVEAADIAEIPTLSLCLNGEGVLFSVHNSATIAENAKDRVFQGWYSTKGKKGRGLGTYSMKFFGEEILGGRVWFESNKRRAVQHSFSSFLPSSR